MKQYALQIAIILTIIGVFAYGQIRSQSLHKQEGITVIHYDDPFETAFVFEFRGDSQPVNVSPINLRFVDSGLQLQDGYTYGKVECPPIKLPLNVREIERVTVSISGSNLSPDTITTSWRISPDRKKWSGWEHLKIDTEFEFPDDIVFFYPAKFDLKPNAKYIQCLIELRTTLGIATGELIAPTIDKAAIVVFAVVKERD